MHKLISLLKDKVFISDGAMGTMLIKKGLPRGVLPEEFNLSHPERVSAVHKSYLSAGANLITTNTFGANRITLSRHNLEDKVEAINVKGCEIARSVVQNKAYISGSIGPTGLFVEPLGELSFDDACNVFAQQAKNLEKGGADLILIETMVDIQELRAAVIGARDATNLPIIACMSFEENLRSATGTDPKTFVAVMEPLGIDVIGSNCGCGLETMLKVANILCEETSLPVLIQPNAGLPRIKQGKTVFEATQDEMANYALSFVHMGVNIVGSCCGSTPEHTKAIKERIKGKKVKKRKDVGQGFSLAKARITSRTETIEFGREFIPIGENINPTGRKKLKASLKSTGSGFEEVKDIALKQVELGARVLDVNVGVLGMNEIELMSRVISVLENTVTVPLLIDSSNGEVFEQSLRIYAGKGCVNSITGKSGALERMLKLVKKYGAQFIGLLIDEKGVPEDIDGRMRIATKIINTARDFGIRNEDIIIDTVVTPVATNSRLPAITLETLKRVKKEFGVATVLGIGNISFGLPNRGIIESAYLTQALSFGLDSALVNLFYEPVRTAIHTGNLLAGREKAEVYVTSQKTEDSRDRSLDLSESENGTDRPEGLSLQKDVIYGNTEQGKEKVKTLLDQGMSPIKIMDKILVPATRIAGDRYEKGEIFLPQLMKTGETMKGILELLQPYFKKEKIEQRGKILIATVKDDWHDIGKSIVGMILSSEGYKIIDLGTDVPTEEIVEIAKEEKVDIIALSALMTTTAANMPLVIKALKKQGVKSKVIIGGGVVDEEFAKDIGADGYAKDGIEAVRVVNDLIMNAKC